jgi:hypothetical protein
MRFAFSIPDLRTAQPVLRGESRTKRTEPGSAWLLICYGVVQESKRIARVADQSGIAIEILGGSLTCVPPILLTDR